VLATEIVRALAREPGHVLAREIEALRVAEHRLVRVVDELAAAFRNLSRKKLAQREAAAVNAARAFVDGRPDTGGCEPIGTRKAGQAGSDDADVNRA